MAMSSNWIQEFWRLLGLVLSLSLFGFWTGEIVLFLLIAGMIYLSWHLYNLFRLQQYLTYKKLDLLPETWGIWNEIFYKIYRWQQRHRKRKRKMRALFKRFQIFTEAVPDAVVILDNNCEIEWMNKAAHELLGLRTSDKGKPITNLLRHPSFGQYLEDLQTTVSSLKLSSPVNSNQMLRINVVLMGKEYLLLARDITQVHRMEQIRRDFIANFSHELRTPLTVIGGFIETMRDTPEECLEEWQQPLLLMAQQTTRMRNLIEDMLLLSRLESESELKISECIEVTELLEAICEEAKILSGEQNHQLSLESDDNLILYGHAGEVRSAFSNLVFNAIRYTPAKGEIKVRWYKDQMGKHFEVCDTGEGIAPEHLPRLTERFYRVDVGRSRQTGGTGLGLAIVKYVLQRHQGRLHMESTLGKGSIFRCDFLPFENNKKIK